MNKKQTEFIYNMFRNWFPYRKYYNNNVLAYKVPIVFLEIVQDTFRILGVKNRCRFRGPRKGLDNRTKIQQRQDCVKKFATSFTVYKRK